MSVDAKVVLLGSQGTLAAGRADPGVGKTSLVVRYVHDKFHRATTSTVGASFLAKKITVDDVQVRLQIWDTAGQERFRSMAPMYYRSATCGILCYDVTNRASFDAVHSWLVELQTNLDEAIIIHLVGTKLDLVRDDPDRRQVPFADCLRYAEAHLAGPAGWTPADVCHEVCAKDDDGVTELFETITRDILRRMPPRPRHRKTRSLTLPLDSDSDSAE
ncbi:rab family GTPase, partial [Dipodascopsis tothii]|uniref:rab family GTPase n=1 Tax=Dipodascopsis tothii TaxID=44089 RepID=UPI0034CEEB4A